MDQINTFMATMPGWLAAIITIAVGLLIAFVLKGVIANVVNKTRFGAKAKTTGGNLGSALGNAAFWLTLLFFIMLALNYLNMGTFVEPLEKLFTDIAAFIPKLLGAGFAFLIGWILAKVAQNATTTTLKAAQVDAIATRTGFASATGSEGSIARAFGTLVFILIIVPVSIAALGILDIDAISGPLTNMLQGFLDIIPNLFGAAIVLGLAIFIGRFVSNFLKGFLPTLGFDNSVNTLMSIDDGEGLRFAPSSIAGNLAFLIITVLGLTAALDILGIGYLSDTFNQVVAFGGQLLQAAVIIMIGVFLANFISRIMAGVISPRVAEFFRYAAMIIFIFIGLNSLDSAKEIIPTAFSSLVIGAAVAGSIAFGVGGVDWAKQVLEKIFPPSEMNGPTPSKETKSGTTRKTTTRRKTPPKV